MTDKAKENISILNTVISQNIEEKFVDATYFCRHLNRGYISKWTRRNSKNEVSTIYKASSRSRRYLYWNRDGKFIREPFIQMADGYNPTDRSWYKEAHENKGKVIVTAPYQSASTKNMVVTIAKEVKRW